jgi:mannosyltransferase OCH1-like enzyme
MSEFPKIIHQVYGFWDNKISKEIETRINSWKKSHSEYKYILWNRKSSREFIKKYYNWFLSLYDNYPYHIQRADSIRYFILYHYGGVYCDIDLTPVKNITPLLEKYKYKKSILYKSPNSELLTNDFMISKKNNNFWKKVWYELIKNYSYNSTSKHLEVMYTTGPLMLDNAYEEFALKKKYVYIIDSKYINNCDISSMKPCYNKEAYLKRYEGNSWHSTDSTFLNFLYKYKFIIFLIIILFLFLKIINK